LTIRLDGTVHFLHQLVDGRLDGGHLCPGQLVEEVGAAQPGELGRLALRDPPLAIPLDRGGEPELAIPAGNPSGNSIVKVLVEP
jgi:hypothetical protein